MSGLGLGIGLGHLLGAYPFYDYDYDDFIIHSTANIFCLAFAGMVC
ncbi:MAG: hypothetical protein ABFC57_11425 [Veillonellales bacterium]